MSRRTLQALVWMIAFGSSPVFGQNETKVVSLVQLIATPKNFDGALISVRGYLVRTGRDHDLLATFLYLHKEDADNMLDSLIVVAPSDQVRNDLRELDRKYVTLTGTFRAVPTTNGSYTPEITQIRSCTLWSDSDHPIGLKNGDSRH